eukprot:CAMPEP_0197849658 /NCGR_PEP_ID=MMETSP1438-20131217/12811_1 /TAXON_ID=1461541 /ORGANISM="Pterosperma sp., Strain CCMP1384" /LENGTH=352 /DNA_ID=CAMNT_0043462441 /DNA_START=87 /DNA_END=1145 /DNA_ORIENTATION=+
MAIDGALSKCDEMIALLESSVADKTRLPKMNVDPDDPWASTIQPPAVVYKEKCPKTGYLMTKPFERNCPMPGAFQGDVSYLDGMLAPITSGKKASTSAPAKGDKPAGGAGGAPAAAAGAAEGGMSKSQAKKEAKLAAKAANKAKSGGGGDGGDKPAQDAPKPAAAAKPAAPAAAPATEGGATVEMWEKAMMKVGVVKEAGFVENSDKLYICQVEVGEDKPRQVITGLRKHVPQDQLQGAKVVVILNLKVAKLAGINSEAMIMATEDATQGEENRIVKLLIPPANAEIGEQVHLQGGAPSDKTTKTLKSSIWDNVKGALRVKSGAATFNSTPLVVASGPLVAAAGIPENAEIK